MAERSFWRIVRTNPPTRRDFLSHVALGIPIRGEDDATLRQAHGISVYATEAQARRKARAVPVLGGWLAELAIGESVAVTVERTAGGPGHHTIWGDADALLACVKRLTPV